MTNRPNDAQSVAHKDNAPLFTALVTAPLSAATVIVLALFGLTTLIGGLAAVGGIGYAVAAPFFAGRTGTSGVFVQIGAGLATSGLGLMIFSAFLFLTRSIAVLWIRLLRYFDGR